MMALELDDPGAVFPAAVGWPSGAGWFSPPCPFRMGSPASASTETGGIHGVPARLEEEDARMATLDTHAIARTLTDAGADPKLADAITAAVREAADHGDHVTPDQFRAGLADLDARIANAETRLTWRMLGVAGLVLAVIRLLN